MKNYRFVTPRRTGKWYPDLLTAQRHASEIGAGYLDKRTGQFVAYVGTVLETIIRNTARKDPATA
ncbi:hypothetical protein [Novosphingobium album (ex Hu et al. 2023)]|uniref:Integrase n=1 Tax=Novosphingobium album (ex Hu et al. 2023) TaxID=2930093 RepID=A0ABT0AXP8_9SPHN|nr:hypothetical protein [Novosphingobium album (ex Hu et al. 2023)]MCJ2177561.1 hypothetical protein [Novosphingobium album (ex Hu et al. 2023)]